MITEYFRAINRRDYAGYLTTQSPGHALTEQQFRTGFPSTVDSSVVVTSITSAPDGRTGRRRFFHQRSSRKMAPTASHARTGR